MKQIHLFIRKLIICGAVLLFLTAAFTYLISLGFKKSKASSYYLSLLDKHDHFKKRATRNNLLVIGGSSNAFGIDSKKINRELGLPVMNFGLHGAFGIQFYCSEAEKEAQAGDIILANIEYEVTKDAFRYGGQQLYEMFFDTNGEGFLYARPGHYYNAFFQFGSIIRKNILWIIHRRNTADVAYSRETCDENGDLQNQPEKGTYKNCSDKRNFRPIEFSPSDYFVATLVKFNSYCKKRDIRLLYSFPPIARSSFNLKRSTELYTKLLNANIPVINKPENSEYCDSLFAGTNYHLCKEGREIYTAKLIGDLKQAGVTDKGIPNKRQRP